MKHKNNLLRSYIYLLITFAMLFSPFSLTKAQVVYEPVTSGVYPFLERLAQKGVIEFNDQIKPLARSYIAGKLIEIKNKTIGYRGADRKNITGLEKDELAFYIKDFGEEIKRLKYNGKNKKYKEENENYNADDDITTIPSNWGRSSLFGKDRYNRWRLFSYTSDLFSVNLSPILGYQAGRNDNASQTHRWNGVYFYGYLGSSIGFSFDFRDNAENGDNIDKLKKFTPVTGVRISKSSADHIEYSEVHTTISANWSWGEATVGKDFLEWGYGQSGKIVLSTKAPSFPFIRLDVHPVPWLRFNYIHAFLNSDVVDSNETYATRRLGFFRTQFRNKYLASHTLTVTPAEGLDISLGESIVYSDRLEISYLIPFMFFRLADHYLSNNNNNAGDNSQFFLGISSRNFIKNTHLYGSIFIDEIRLGDLFDPEKQRNQFGFTLGASAVDLPVENLTVTVEATRILPFVYSHFIPTQTYESSGYLLGHWIGHNADLIFGSLNYRFIRGLEAKVWGQYVRKGGEGVIDQQYTVPSQPFLFGLRTNYTYFGADIKYEFIHELFAKASFQYTKVSTEQSSGGFIDDSRNEFSLAVYYGL